MTKKRGANQSSGPAPYTPPHRPVATCPACISKIVWEPRKDDVPIPCDPQLRIVVFSGFKRDVKNIPAGEYVVGIEVGTGKVVEGRSANAHEKRYYKKNKTLSGLVPWAIARVNHLDTCTRVGQWLNGEAKIPSIEYGSGESTRAIEHGDREMKDWAIDVESSIRGKEKVQETLSLNSPTVHE